MWPLKRSTDSIGSRQVVSSEPVAMAEAVIGRELHRPADHVGNAVESLRPFEAFEVLPAFAFQFSRLDQQEPASRRQVIRQVGQAAGSGEQGAGSRSCDSACSLLPAPRSCTDRRDINRLEPLQASLACHLELPDRLDLIAEQLDPHGVEPVGSKDVDDSAAMRELAGQFHGRRVLKAAARRANGKSLRPKAARRFAGCGSARPIASGWGPAARGPGCW